MPPFTGLEEELAKLSTNTVETAENPEVVNICEDQREAVAGPDPKKAAKEKRKRKRQADKAAAAATKAKAVDVADVVNNNDVDMTNANKVVDKKEVVEDDSFTLVGPRRGRSEVEDDVGWAGAQSIQEKGLVDTFNVHQMKTSKTSFVSAKSIV